MTETPLVTLTVPDRQGEGGQEILSDIRGLVAVGANGAGKTRFGYRLLELNGNSIHSGSKPSG